MSEKGGRPENLIPQSQRTPEEARAMGRKGGIASGKVRKEKKLLSQIYGEMLTKEYDVTIDGKPSKMSGAAFVQSIAREIINRRDSASVSMLKEIREATEGQNINVDGDLRVADVTAGMTHDEKRELVKQWVQSQKNL